MSVVIRLLRTEDSLVEMTWLLNLAYRSLAQMGLNYTASYQDVATTAERIEDAETYVADLKGRIVGTITLYAGDPDLTCAWYARPDVAHFGQFAVLPELQGQGIGSALIAVVEDRARALGKAELALDTAEPATHLVDLYKKRGYRTVSVIQWNGKSYRSLVLSKALHPKA